MSERTPQTTAEPPITDAMADKYTRDDEACLYAAAQDAIGDALHALHQGNPTIALRCLERAASAVKEIEHV